MKTWQQYKRYRTAGIGTFKKYLTLEDNDFVKKCSVTTPKDGMSFVENNRFNDSSLSYTHNNVKGNYYENSDVRYKQEYAENEEY